MINKKHKYIAAKIFFILFAAVSVAFTVSGTEGGGGKSLQKSALKAGDAYRFFINNIDMPLNKSGILADVQIGNNAGGLLDGKIFLFSGGFFLSGKTNGQLWSNAVASASRIQDYHAGTYASGRNDSRAQIYVLSTRDGDFAPSWEEWKDAVALGAYYYDGNGDGVYNPSDDNGNGKWDPTEDRPDLLGAETAWTVFHDGVNPADRRFNNVDPQGIEIRQTVFGLASKGVTGNMIFVRYSLLNTGLKADTLDDVYFGVWADPDLGSSGEAYLDDLVGSDTTLNAGYVYNDGDDTDWGSRPPAFIIDFFQGPVSYVPGESFVDANGNGVYDAGETALDTAFNRQGPVRGVAEFPGAKNLGLSSFVHYMQSHPELGDPNTREEARNYMLGLNKNGGELDPCTWGFGNVVGGVPCDQVNNQFWYSGDPTVPTGWINNFPTDQRQMSNTGPFKLVKGQPVDVVAAYVVGRGSNALNSVEVAKDNDRTAQTVFDNNFPSPPPPPPIEYQVQTGNGFIDITWETSDQVTHNAVDTVLGIDRRFEGFYLTAYRTNEKSATVEGVDNAEIVAVYDLSNFINNVYKVVANGGQDLVLPEAKPENKLDPGVYADVDQGRIRVRITKDFFSNTPTSPLIKGHRYYYSITHYYLDHNAIVNRATGTYGPEGDYLDPTGGSAIEEYDTPIITVTYGEDLYSPSQQTQSANLASGGTSDGDVKYLILNQENLTGNTYEVTFGGEDEVSGDNNYTPSWTLTNTTTGEVLVDSSLVYNFDTTSFAGKATQGFLVKVKPVTPELGEATYSGDRWYSTFRNDSATGVYYVGTDIPEGRTIDFGSGTASARSTAISAKDLRKVEIRFGQPGKAYRYVNGYVGTAISRRTSYVYAGKVSAADTLSAGGLGKFGQGYVDVPFQVWVKDPYFNEEKQLAVAFVERSATLGGNPDGEWDPGTNLKGTGEVIIVLNSPYDPNGSQLEYTGSASATVPAQYADIVKGYTLSDPSATPEQVATAKSPLFDAMYVVGLQRMAPSMFFDNGDVFTMNVDTYPYTPKDKFQFTTKQGAALTTAEQQEIFNKVNVFPNPLFGYNPATSYEANTAPDNVFVTFSNLPAEVTVKIYTLSGTLVRTLTTADKSSPTSPFLRWDLQNEDGLRMASGMYLAIVTNPQFGEKLLKFAVIMPQKQIQRY